MRSGYRLPPFFFSPFFEREDAVAVVFFLFFSSPFPGVRSFPRFSRRPAGEEEGEGRRRSPFFLFFFTSCWRSVGRELLFHLPFPFSSFFVGYSGSSFLKRTEKWIWAVLACTYPTFFSSERGGRVVELFPARRRGNHLYFWGWGGGVLGGWGGSADPAYFSFPLSDGDQMQSGPSLFLFFSCLSR